MDEHQDLDPFTADALLDGAAPDDASEGIVSALAALHSPPTGDELDGGDAVFAAVTAPAPGGALRRLTAKTAAVSAAAVLTFGGVAAATVGLPVVDDLLPGGDEPELVEVELVGDPDAGVTAAESSEGEGAESSEDAEDAEGEELEGDGENGEHGERVSAAAHMDCGKKVEVTDKDEATDEDGVSGEEAAEGDAPADVAVEEPDEDCLTARNHGEYVSAIARDKDGDGEPDVGKDKAPGQMKKALREAAEGDGEAGTEGDETETDETELDETELDEAETAEADAGDSPGRSNGKGQGKGKNKGD